MAGTWMSIVKGFGGMTIQDHQLNFEPFLPKQWDEYAFKINFRANQLAIKTHTQAGATVRRHLGQFLTIKHDRTIVHGQQAHHGTHQRGFTRAVATGQTDDKTFNLLAASYDFGVAKLVGGYQTMELESKGIKQGDNDSLYFGVQAPVAKNINVYFGYAGSEYDAVTGTDYKTTGYTLAANYVLSKRTDAYIGYTHIKTENDTTGADMGKVKTLAVGVRHAF